MQAYGELRFLMGGATAITGAGGVPGLIRNIDTSADALEGAPALIATSDTFPLGTPGMNLESGCGYTKIETNFVITQGGEYIPHISEGIDPEAHNEFYHVHERRGRQEQSHHARHRRHPRRRD